ncbi:hypothetical protein PRIPAC_84951, partial [Pristionchus pacificus]
ISRVSTNNTPMSGMPYFPNFNKMWRPAICSRKAQVISDLETSIGKCDLKYESKVERIVEKQRIEIQRLTKKLRDATSSIENVMGRRERLVSFCLLGRRIVAASVTFIGNFKVEIRRIGGDHIERV